MRNIYFKIYGQKWRLILENDQRIEVMLDIFDGLDLRNKDVFDIARSTIIAKTLPYIERSIIYSRSK